MGTRARHSTFEQRLDWLVKNRGVWFKWHMRADSTEWDNGQKLLFRRMQRDGLYAPTTYHRDCPLKNELHAASAILQLGDHKNL